MAKERRGTQYSYQIKFFRVSTSAVTHLFRQSPHSGENVTTFFSGHTEFPCLISTASYSIKIAQVEK